MVGERTHLVQTKDWPFISSLCNLILRESLKKYWNFLHVEEVKGMHRDCCVYKWYWCGAFLSVWQNLCYFINNSACSNDTLVSGNKKLKMLTSDQITHTHTHTHTHIYIYISGIVHVHIYMHIWMIGLSEVYNSQMNWNEYYIIFQVLRNRMITGVIKVMK